MTKRKSSPTSSPAKTKHSATSPKRPTPVQQISPPPSAATTRQMLRRAAGKVIASLNHLIPIRPGGSSAAGTQGGAGGGDEPPRDQKVYCALVRARFLRLHTYQELETLSRIPEYGYLARDVKLQQMKCLSEEVQDVTQVDLCGFDETVDPALSTGKLDLSGIMHSIDIHYLNDRLRETRNEDYAILSIHPDDWVAGRSQPPDPQQRWCDWSLHGKLEWNTRASGDPDVKEELVSLRGSPRKTPGRGMQSGRPVTSPVVDHHIIELADEGSSPLLKYLPNAVRFIETHINVPGRRVLVHCKVGHSRSASVVTAYLMYRYYHGVVEKNIDQKTWEDAGSKAEHMKQKCNAILSWLATQRPGVRPPEENNFTQQLHAYADYLVSGTMPAVPPAKIKRDGGDQMRDAAVVVFFHHNQRPFLNLIKHYFERRTPDFNRFPAEMYEFMLKWLVLEDLGWNPHTKLLEDVEPNA